MTSKASQERAAAKAAANKLPERETYSAKQAALRLGTDARTFRKFLRSSHCSFEAVGQGKRYEFEATELKALKDEFQAWRTYAESRRTTSTPKDTVPIEAVMETAKEIYINGNPTPKVEKLIDNFEEDFDREPTPEELMALEMGLDEEED